MIMSVEKQKALIDTRAREFAFPIGRKSRPRRSDSLQVAGLLPTAPKARACSEEAAGLMSELVLC